MLHMLEFSAHVWERLAEATAKTTAEEWIGSTSVSSEEAVAQAEWLSERTSHVIIIAEKAKAKVLCFNS